MRIKARPKFSIYVSSNANPNYWIRHPVNKDKIYSKQRDSIALEVECLWRLPNREIALILINFDCAPTE